MKEKNGFVFMETIVVVSVLSITLLLLFSSYSYILRKSKARDTFDTTEMIYKTYFAKQIIDNYKAPTSVCARTKFQTNCYGIEYYIETHMNKSGGECSQMGSFDSYVCDLSGKNYNGYLSQLKNAYEVDKIYYANPKEILSDSKKSEWLKLFDATTIDYINQLGKGRNNKLIIIKYKKRYSKKGEDYEVYHASIEAGQNSYGYINFGSTTTIPEETTDDGSGTTVSTTTGVTSTAKTNFRLYFDVNLGISWTADTCKGAGVIFEDGKCYKNVIYGQVLGELPIPLRNNHALKGWSNAQVGGSIFDENKIFKFKEDKTLYAQWEADRIDLTDFGFYTLDGKTPGASPESILYPKSGSRYNLYAGIVNYDISEYQNKGESWYLNIVLTNDIIVGGKKQYQMENYIISSPTKTPKVFNELPELDDKGVHGSLVIVGSDSELYDSREAFIDLNYFEDPYIGVILDSYNNYPAKVEKIELVSRGYLYRRKGLDSIVTD